MTSTLVEVVQWGKDFKTKKDEIASFFYKSPGREALREVQRWTGKNDGRVESAHGILERRIQETVYKHPWVFPGAVNDPRINFTNTIGRKKTWRNKQPASYKAEKYWKDT